MSTFDLLDAVLPPEGRFCALGLGRYADQHFVETREEVTKLAQRFVKAKFDAFFGCAKYGPLNNREHKNAIYFRALWVDIDCGPSKAEPDEKGRVKGYIDQSTGLAELQKFCKTVGLPRPILVSSGYGVHAYWLLDSTIEQWQWKPLAERLRELCNEHQLIVDPSVFEPSRVLRIPGTFNFKNGETKEVVVLNEETLRMSYAQVQGILSAEAPKPVEERPAFIPAVSPMMEALLANKIKRFKTIMMKTANGVGCNQLLHCYENQASIEEPLWRSALSITAFCVDKDTASHKMSNKHPEYNPAEVDGKIAHLVAKGGPHHCATFEKQNPTGCDGCTHKGSIKSPIVLGVEIAEATEEDNEVEVETEEGSQTVTIPEYPFPYFRGKNGGIYIKPGADEEDGPKLVYEHDLYVVKRMRDPEMGEVALFRLHLPHDGIKEFAISTAVISSKDELRKMLAQQGVVAHPKQYESLSSFVVMCIKNLQYEKKADTMRTQFGWIDNDSKFIMGDKEITKDGMFYSPPTLATESLAHKIHAKGSMEKWREVYDLYGLPGMEGQAFGALTAFGSPIFKFTGLDGALINLIYEFAGSGKSTVLRMCNSVYGMPKELMATAADTLNAKIQQLGVLNNMPNTIDEITNMKGLEFSDMAYAVSQGRGKNRMRGSVNQMRTNNTTWQNMSLCSSNASFYEKLGSVKSSPDGESVRLIEYRIEPSDIISVAHGKQMFDHQLNENYGHAGVIYIQWLVNNLEEAKQLLAKVQARLDRDLQLTSRERFWSASVASNITGGLIAKGLGLINFDMKAVYAWALTMIKNIRNDVKTPQSNPVATLGEFINEHINNTLVVSGNVDTRSGMNALPTLEPRGELLIRYEPDTKMIYIAAKQFKSYCVEQQTNYSNLLQELKALGVYQKAENKRMAAGMKVKSPSVRALWFDGSTSEFLQVDSMIGTDEGRDSLVSD